MLVGYVSYIIYKIYTQLGFIKKWLSNCSTEITERVKRIDFIALFNTCSIISNSQKHCYNTMIVKKSEI